MKPWPLFLQLTEDSAMAEGGGGKYAEFITVAGPIERDYAENDVQRLRNTLWSKGFSLGPENEPVDTIDGLTEALQQGINTSIESFLHQIDAAIPSLWNLLHCLWCKSDSE